jgi:ribonuclease HII
MGPLDIGVDEAGRGPLAGPVCAAAVALGPSAGIAGLADSKTLSEKKRSTLAPLIQSQSLAWGIGWASVEEIERMDILRATFLAMSRAAEGCLSMLADRGPAPVIDAVRMQVDGSHSPGKFKGPWQWPYATETVVKGDQKIACISAASILAKTARDEEMRRLDALYPHYGFAAHAGYGTARHLQAIAKHGICPEHRKTFAPVARHLQAAAEHRSGVQQTHAR